MLDPEVTPEEGVESGGPIAESEAPIALRAETKTVFYCWKCQKALRELPGEAHIVWDQVQCPGCGALNALVYAFPTATVETV